MTIGLLNLLEVRKKSGEEYPPNIVHHICCGLLLHLRWNGRPSIDFFSDPTSFKDSMDSEMRRLQEKGAGSKNKQAEVLAEEEEEILGENTTQTRPSPE